MKRLLGILLLGATLALSLTLPVSAKSGDGVIQLAAQEQFISLDDAVARVRRQIDGEVISAKTRYQDGRPVHYVKVYDRGRVRTLRVDARSGRIM